jgi:hypothetical protein
MVFICLKCNSEFRSNCDLNRHLSRKNKCLNEEEKLKKNDCIGCGKTFYDLSNRNRHMKKCPNIIGIRINNIETQNRILQEENMRIREENLKIREDLINSKVKNVKNITNNNNNITNNNIKNVTINNNNSEIKYGYLYVRDNENYRRDNVYKIGVTKNLFNRNNQYKTGEFTQSEYIYLIKMNFDILYSVDMKMKKILKPYNLRDNAGTEFYHRDVMDDIEKAIKSLDVEYCIIQDKDEIIEEMELNEIQT